MSEPKFEFTAVPSSLLHEFLVGEKNNFSPLSREAFAGFIKGSAIESSNAIDRLPIPLDNEGRKSSWLAEIRGMLRIVISWALKDIYK